MGSKGCHHFNRAAREPEQEGPHGFGARPTDSIFQFEKYCAQRARFVTRRANLICWDYLIRHELTLPYTRQIPFRSILCYPMNYTIACFDCKAIHKLTGRLQKNRAADAALHSPLFKGNAIIHYGTTRS